ncbi:hypothetical protein HME7025_00088 [Aquirufa nivalisilvae]|uniref:Uncharacterized protein n=1 Tax=Aquirufa nivalisilvae TaxID=2516557 RepID=A0A2S2DRF8_9BACT|nr:hypothetical protein [Aquirufa nivalisilvae]AWL07973.1 hypothetical protein HME7025_00088 [Aquirufa nivalisilvae]
MAKIAITFAERVKLSAKKELEKMKGDLALEDAPTPEPAPEPTPEPTPEPAPEPAPKARKASVKK